MSTLIKQMEGEAHPVSEAPQAESPTSPSTGQLAGPSGEQEALLWSRVKQHLLHAFSDRARVSRAAPSNCTHDIPIIACPLRSRFAP